MAISKPKLLTNKGKTPLGKLGASALKKPKSPLFGAVKKNHKKSSLPDQAFAIPGFGDTGLTGRS